MTEHIELDEAAEARARTLHEESIVIDGLVTKSYLEDDEYRTHLAAGGLTAANVTVASRTDFAGATEEVQHCRRIIEDNDDELLLVESAADLEAAGETDRVGVVMGFQDSMPIEPRENMRVDNDLSSLGAFDDMGVRIVQLTYNYQNRVGAGCCERTDPGLSYFGRDVVDEMNRRGILVDVSHCGDRTTAEAIEYSDDPVVCSHAGLRSMSNVGRNKTDEHVRALGENGGLLGITFFPPCVKSDPETHEVQEATVHDVLDQIDRAVELAGVDHVGFGSDMNDQWLDEGATPTYGAYRNFRPKHPEVYGRGPLDRFEPFPEGIHRHTKLETLTRGLVSRGYSDEDVEKILGGNFVRVLSTVRGS